MGVCIESGWIWKQLPGGYACVDLVLPFAGNLCHIDHICMVSLQCGFEYAVWYMIMAFVLNSLDSIHNLEKSNFLFENELISNKIRKYYLIQNGSLPEEARTIYASVPMRRNWKRITLNNRNHVGSLFRVIFTTK